MFEVLHLVGPFVIGTATRWASRAEVFYIIEAGGAKIKDVRVLAIDVRALSDLPKTTLTASIAIL